MNRFSFILSFFCSITNYLYHLINALTESILSGFVLHLCNGYLVCCCSSKDLLLLFFSLKNNRLLREIRFSTAHVMFCYKLLSICSHFEEVFVRDGPYIYIYLSSTHIDSLTVAAVAPLHCEAAGAIRSTMSHNNRMTMDLCQFLNFQ